MLKNQIQQLDKEMPLYLVEKEYMKENNISFHENGSNENIENRFLGAYIERSNKETDELIETESDSFLSESISYFKKQKAEFLYVESKWFHIIAIDAVSLEVDDVFGTYEAMLGLKLKKNQEKTIKSFLDRELLEGEKKYNLMFNQQDGLWDLNITLDVLKGFEETMTIGEVIGSLYQFIFQLLVEVEKTL